jgi:2-polyprenyl-6-methoxyphenol hydroxylase-like FAD-dependent oxidoreductase
VDILIIGGGVGGLTLALALHKRNPACGVRIFEAANEFKPLGVGINLMPHAIRILDGLGVRDTLAKVSVEAKEFAFFTHNGQFIYREPCGLFAGYKYPHFSIHRASLHDVLYSAVRERLGTECVITGHRCIGVEQDASGVTARFADQNGRQIAAERGDVSIGCDGIHSNVRKQFYRDEGPPVFHGINMWRGVTRAKPFLSGASATRIGALYRTSKLAVYPIRDNVDGTGNQLINWVAEVVTDELSAVDWSAPGKLEDFYHIYKDWVFDWLDCAALLRDADFILTYPMVDRDPIGRWTFDRVTLLGDAAHPMYPRGGNGGAQSIIDASTLAELLNTQPDAVSALREYEATRLEVVNRIVLQNRSAPPDTIIELVEERTGGKRFDNLDDIVSPEEMRAIHENYQRIAGYHPDAVNQNNAGTPST